MSLQTKDITKICGFYASSYHLAVMLLPYISKKLERGEKIVPILEKEIENEIETLVNKINITNDLKKEILKINWKNTNNLNIEDLKEKGKIEVIITGDEESIRKKNRELENMKNISIINLFNLEEKNNMAQILANYDYIINTSGVHEKEAI